MNGLVNQGIERLAETMHDDALARVEAALEADFNEPVIPEANVTDAGPLYDPNAPADTLPPVVIFHPVTAARLK